MSLGTSINMIMHACVILYVCVLTFTHTHMCVCCTAAHDCGMRHSLQYARVDHKTDMDVMMSLLKGCWNMEAPNLLISVTGGAKNFKMRPRLKEMFRQGLMKAAKSTGMGLIKWYVTLFFLEIGPAPTPSQC